MATYQVSKPRLEQGDFVRTKLTSIFRPGQDGRVVAPDDGVKVRLVFGNDRYNRTPVELGVTYTGIPEVWRLDELDLTSIKR